MQALHTWEATQLDRAGASVTITSLPGQHGPGIVDDALPPVMGSMLDFRGADIAPLRIYISGDTLVHEDLHEIPRRFPGVDLAILHLGGTRLLGIWLTMNGEMGVEALNIINSQIAMPVHYDDYTVFKSPLSEFTDAAKAAGIEDRIVYVDRGQHCQFSVVSPSA